MLYVQLDTNWPDNPKIIQAGLELAGLHAVVMCLAKRLEADGWVHRRLLHRQGATDDMIDRLVLLELLEGDDVRVRPHDWLDRNPSQAVIAARRASKAEAGKRGNHAKWKHAAAYEICVLCHPESLVIARSDRTGSQPIAECLTKPESKSEVTAAIPPANDLARRALSLADKGKGATDGVAFPVRDGVNG